MAEMTYGQLRDMSAEDVYKAMAAQVNGPGSGFERILRASFRAEHPTLQQAMIRHVIRPMLEVLVKDEAYADARNEAATDFALLAVRATENVRLPTI